MMVNPSERTVARPPAIALVQKQKLRMPPRPRARRSVLSRERSSQQGSSPPERRCLILACRLVVGCRTPDSWRAQFFGQGPVLFINRSQGGFERLLSLPLSRLPPRSTTYLTPRNWRRNHEKDHRNHASHSRRRHAGARWPRGSEERVHPRRLGLLMV